MSRDNDIHTISTSHSAEKDAAGVVICGAGIAGISAAYHPAVKQRMKNVVLVDERPPVGQANSWLPMLPAANYPITLLRSP